MEIQCKSNLLRWEGGVAVCWFQYWTCFHQKCGRFPEVNEAHCDDSNVIYQSKCKGEACLQWQSKKD